MTSTINLCKGFFFIIIIPPREQAILAPASSWREGEGRGQLRRHPARSPSYSPCFSLTTSAARTHKLCVIAAFSSVPGVIDCTHKTIHVPLHNEVSFINHKSSLNMQVVFAARFRKTDVVAKFMNVINHSC